MPCQVNFGEQRQQDLEVEAQRPDHDHHRERDPQLGPGEDDLDGLARPGRGRGRCGASGCGGAAPSPRSATSIATKLRALSAKQGPTPATAISTPASAGPTMRAVWTITLLSATALTIRSGPTSSDDERLARRVVDGVDRAADEHEPVDHPDLDGAGQGQREQRQRGDGHQRLRDHQQAALVVAVGEHAAEDAEEQDREELEAGGDADRDAGAGQLHDEPHLGDDLHPVADQRDDLAGEVAPVVGDLERGQRAAECERQERPSSCSSMRSSRTAARSQRRAVLGGAARAGARRGRRSCGCGSRAAGRGPRRWR